MVQQAMGHRRFMLVRKGIIALLAFVLALHAGFQGITEVQAAIKAPCCGPNCPAPLSLMTDRAARYKILAQQRRPFPPSPAFLLSNLSPLSSIREWLLFLRY